MQIDLMQNFISAYLQLNVTIFFKYLTEVQVAMMNLMLKW